MQAYNRYKDSGIEWLGEIPEHWEVYKGQFLFDIINDKTAKGDEELLSVSEHYGVKKRSESNVSMFLAANYEGYKLCKKGDLVINSLWAWSRGLGFSEYNGIVSTAYSVYRPKAKLDYHYFHYLLRIEKYVAQYLIASKGIWISRLQLSDWAFLRISLLFPPLPEQQAIAAFLDDKCGKIDEAVRIRQQQIEKLKELRQITIHNAVTKGINPNAEMKDSGIDWIGEIPKHWGVKRLKNLIQDLEGGVSVNASESESANENEIGVLKTSCVYQYKFDSTQNKKVLEYDLKRVSCPVRKGAIIISRMNAPELVGASGLVLASHPNLFLPDRLWQTIYVSDISFDASWLSNILISKGFRDYMITFANGSSPSMKNISKSDFLNIFIPFPTVPEQKALVTYLEEKTTKIDEAISRKTEQITKLREYKQSLINEVVTGKVKVAN